MISIMWTPEKRDELRRQYDEAFESGANIVVIDGHTILLGYAKYLLQYLDQQMPPAPRRAYARSRGGR